MTIFLMLVIALLIALVSKPLVLVLFGRQFAEAVPALQVLLLGTVALGTIDVTWNHAAASGKPGLGISIFGLNALLDAVLNFLLTPKFGVLGASIAATISYWMAALFFLWFFCKAEGCSLRDALIVKHDDIKELVQAVKGLPAIVRERTISE